MSFVQTCQRIGNDLELVQGPGGNISMKGEEMMIKASGLTLGQVTEEQGHVIVDHARVGAFLQGMSPDAGWDPSLEASYLQELRSARKEAIAMPSLETGFHAILSDAVIHTHPIIVNAYTCSKDGPAVLRELFPDAVFVPYVTVGVLLGKAVENAGAKAGDGKPIFLMNHGLITHGASLEEAEEQTLQIVEVLTRDLEQRGAPLPGTFTQTDGGFQSDSLHAVIDAGLEDNLYHLFPDSVIYCHDRPNVTRDGSIFSSRNAAENLHASAAITLAAQALGGVQPLSAEHVDILNELQSEDYRRKIGENIK